MDVIWDVGQGELLLSPTTRVIVEVKRFKWVPMCIEVEACTGYHLHGDVINEKKMLIGLKRQTLLPISTQELSPKENIRSATLTK